VLIACVEGVLVHQVGDGGSELSPVGAGQFFDHLLVFINGGQEPHAVGLQQLFGAKSVFFPHFTRNERRVNNHHVKGAPQTFIKLIPLVEVEINEILVFLAEVLIDLQS
jgi:hypothetical protein